MIITRPLDTLLLVDAACATLLDISSAPPIGIGLGELLAIGGICCAIFVPVIVVVGGVLYSKRKRKSDD